MDRKEGMIRMQMFFSDLVFIDLCLLLIVSGGGGMYEGHSEG